MDSIYKLYNYYTGISDIGQKDEEISDPSIFRLQFPQSVPVKIIGKNIHLTKTIFIIDKKYNITFLKSQIKQKNKLLSSGFSLAIDKRLLLGTDSVEKLDIEYSNNGFLIITLEETRYSKK